LDKYRHAGNTHHTLELASANVQVLDKQWKKTWKDERDYWKEENGQAKFEFGNLLEDL